MVNQSFQNKQTLGQFFEPLYVSGWEHVVMFEGEHRGSEVSEGGRRCRKQVTVLENERLQVNENENGQSD